MIRDLVERIWDWIKSTVLKLPRAGPALTPHRNIELEKKLARDIQKNQGKGVDTRRGGPNMPKYQPCDICNRGAKRVQKTLTGAKYHCKKCNNDIIVAAK